MEERRPITREQAIISNWARKHGIEPPPGTKPDAFGLLSGSVIKFGLGQPNQDDVDFVSRMKANGYDVKSSKDGLSWEWSIPATRAEANLKAQHDRAIQNTRPTKNEVVNPGEEGYFGLESTFETGVPMTIDRILNPAPANVSGYEASASSSGSE